MINVIVIDDSAFMRKAIQIMLESDPEIKVIATARDGMEGFDKVMKYQPDIVTLDLEMPRTNGLECLSMIMKEVPTPVLVVSSLTTNGAQVTLEALNKGAVDFIPKTQSFVAIDIIKIENDLINKVKTIANRNHRSRLRRNIRAKKESEIKNKLNYKNLKVQPFSLEHHNIRCVAIGVSTGGPPVIQSILNSLPGDFPASILIAQHMPKEFTKIFAERINKSSAINVKEAETGDVIQKGNAYIAQGGKHLIVKRQGVNIIGELTQHPVKSLYHPSVDVLFSSTTEAYGSSVLGVILTGMGKDGVKGLKLLKNRGGLVIAQNEESCVVYGMPKAAVDAGVVDHVQSVDGISASIKSISGNSRHYSGKGK